MKNGLYEKVLTKVAKESLANKEFIEIRNIDNSELPKVLATTYQKVIRETLSQIQDREDRIKFIKGLNNTIGIKGFEYEDEKFKELLTVHEDKKAYDELKTFRPKTSIATSTLFTGYTGPTLLSELSREIRTADEINFLVSFIKFSGLRLIYEDLVEFTKKNKLRVITTSYMGASDYKAILELAKLPNTEVKISYDTKRTRLHAKAYHFKRNTGFSTAYIGSSNLSNPALSNGLEWNLKVSEYTSIDVIDSIIKNIETYWNDDEFVTFNPKDEENKKELKESLKMSNKEDASYVFFDLKPYSHQKEILEDLKVEREEHNSYKNLVVAATGTGKTLIGLLIGEFRRRKYNEKVIYLCPNNQLVNQTLEYSRNNYGIKAVGFTGSARDYDPKDKTTYLTGKGIAITNYSSLFNTNSFFQDPDIIIFDDAHSGENYISSNWTVTIDRFKDKDLYYLFAEAIKDLVEDMTYERMTNDNPSLTDWTWFDKIPNIKLLDKYLDIQKIIDEYIMENYTDIKFPWSNIKDNLSSCNFYLSWREIVIRPYIPPTLTFLPFKKAKQRIYMSATLGKSGELERAFGIPKITRLPMVKDWENKTIGRKYFMFPSASFDLKQTGNIIKKITEITDRVLMIVKNNDTQNGIIEFLEKNTEVDIFTGKDIEYSKEEFISSKHGFAIVANRFDGIDFPNDECRMLILFDLPNATHLQENFLITRMAAMTLFEERIKTRVVQALGRCTRSNTDYAAVCVFGDDLMNSLISPAKLKQFNPELQSELLFGLNNSENQDNLDDYLELLDIFLNNREEWEAVEQYIISNRDKIISESSELDNSDYHALMDSSKHEVYAQYDIWKEDYKSALDNIEVIISKLNRESLKGYRGFWFYIGAYCAYNIFKNGDRSYESVYKKYLLQASKTTISINWFNKIIDIEDKGELVNNYMEYILEDIEKVILKASKASINKFYYELDYVLDLLESNDGNKFEIGHEKLGNLLGYRTFNPKGDAEPDPIWILNDKFCIVSEDKIYKNFDKPIPPKHVRQAAGHVNWVKSNYKQLSMGSELDSITVFITNSTNIEESASIHGEDIYYLNRDDLLEYANRCIKVLKEIRKSFDNVGDVIWREKVIDKFVSNKITPMDYINLITKWKLSNFKNGL